MTKRILITIPDHLYERLQVVKSSVNVSGLCREAIETFVTIQELKLKDNPQMYDVIERLKLEKQQKASDWKTSGITDGKEDATTLSYEEFQDLESTQKIDEDLQEWIENKRLRYFDKPDKDSYLEGWLEGVLSFWDEVKDQL